MKTFFPGDIVRYGFGIIHPKGQKYRQRNVVCVVKHIQENRYKAVWLSGDSDVGFDDYYLDDTLSDTELLFTFHPNEHTMKVTKL